jgi:hypothetical protein
MTMPFIYAVTHQVSPPAVYTINQAGSGTQLGNTFDGSPPAEVHGTDDNRTNTVVNFKGGIYCWHRDTIREIDSDGMGGTSLGNWGTVFTTSQTGGGENMHSGLYVVYPDGVPTMVGMFKAGNFIRGVKTTDGVNFTESAATGSAVSTSTFGRARVFNNELYWSIGYGSGIPKYNPSSNALQFIPINPVTSNFTTARDFYALGNKFYMAGIQSTLSSTPFSLWELQASGFERIHIFSGTLTGNGRASCPSLFSSTGNELFIQLSGSTGGSGDVSYVATGLGTPSQSIGFNSILPVIPNGFEPGGIYATGRSRYYIFVDNEVHEDRINGSTTFPDLFQFVTADPESAAGLYPVAGNYVINPLTGGSFMTGFLSNEFTLSTAPFGGGDRVHRYSGSPNPFYAILENPTPGTSSGTTDVSFRVYGSGTGFTGIVYYSSQQNWVENTATLTGSVTGGSASLSANTIINVDADDGTTLYTFTWDHATDGITNGIPLRMNIELL